jgi:cephalosporin-C deacetylase-like acetyl esterase
MPLIDKPLPELLVYRGRNPRPDDFDEYWSAALREPRLGYIDCQHLASRVRADVLMFTGLMDATCPPSSQFAVYNNLTAPKDIVIYPDFSHEPLPGMIDRVFNFMRKL